MLMSNLKIRYVQNDNLKISQLSKIIHLKRQYWKYSINEHKKWIDENIKNEDIHLMVYDFNEKLLAYLNIVNTIMIFKDFKENIYGIGNVCVDNKFKGRGLGRLLMNICNYYLSSSDKIIALFCKPELVKFYEQSGWIKFNKKVVVNGEQSHHILMLNRAIEADEIIFVKNF